MFGLGYLNLQHLYAYEFNELINRVYSLRFVKILISSIISVRLLSRAVGSLDVCADADALALQLAWPSEKACVGLAVRQCG